MKQRFTTRFDPEVLAKAKEIADRDGRSVTSVLEMAVIAMAKRYGVTLGTEGKDQ